MTLENLKIGPSYGIQIGPSLLVGNQTPTWCVGDRQMEDNISEERVEVIRYDTITSFCIFIES